MLMLLLCFVLLAEGTHVSRFNRLAIKESRGGVTQPCVGMPYWATACICLFSWNVAFWRVLYGQNISLHDDSLLPPKCLPAFEGVIFVCVSHSGFWDEHSLLSVAPDAYSWDEETQKGTLKFVYAFTFSVS